jgi:serine/threonine protein kinase
VFARKIIRVFGHSTAADIENEAKAVAALCSRQESKYVVHVIEHGWLTKTNLFYFIDMEYCPETLEDRILQWQQQSARLETPQAFASNLEPQVDIDLQPTTKPSGSAESRRPVGKTSSQPEKIEWSPILKIFADITRGLRYMHGKGFVHRDLKPKNGKIL